MTYKLTINKLILIGGIALFFFLLSSQTSHAACENVPLKGSYIITASCTFSASTGVFGVDDGGITINAGQGLTINDGQTIVWGPNKSIVINGTIAINNGGQLKQARIYVKDADEDGYPTKDAHVAQIGSPGAGYVYRSQLDVSMTYTTDLAYDYNDNSTSTYPGTKCDGQTCSLNDSNGDCVVAADDSVCGSVCAGWYVQTGTEAADNTEYCYNKQELTSRCAAVGQCKEANADNCSSQSNDTEQYSCGSCKYIHNTNACYQTTPGSCTDYTLTWGGSHSCANCTGAAGTYFDTNGSGSICKFSQNACPGGWTQAANWQKYSAAEWGGDACGWHKSTGPASFSNQLAVKKWDCCGNCSTDHGCNCCSGNTDKWHTCQFQEYRCGDGWYCHLCWNVSSSNNPTDNRTEIGCY